MVKYGSDGAMVAIRFAGSGSITTIPNDIDNLPKYRHDDKPFFWGGGSYDHLG